MQIKKDQDLGASLRDYANYFFKITQAAFSAWPKTQDKNLNIFRKKMKLRWSKKHFSSFLKGFHWSKEIFFGRGEPDLKHCYIKHALNKSFILTKIILEDAKTIY